MSHNPPQRGGAPSAVEAEKAVLGAILLTGQWYKGLSRDLFHHPDLGQIYEIAEKAHAEGGGVDMVSLVGKVAEKHGLIMLFTTLPGQCTSVEAVPFWMRSLREARAKRRIWWWGREVEDALATHNYERLAELQQSRPPPESEGPEAESTALPATTHNRPHPETLKLVKRAMKRKAAQTTLADIVLRSDPTWAGQIWWNTYRKLMMVGQCQVMDADYQRISIWLDVTYRIHVAQAAVAPIVSAVGHDNARNPLQEYLTGIRWDGQERLSTWLSVVFGVEDTDLHRIIGRRWLIQAAARALTPGCKADIMLVLAGKQGIRKSSALRELAGIDFFSDSPIPIGEGPRAMSQVYSAWIHEIPELASLRGKAVEDVKSFTTKTHDDFQPLYAKAPVHWARFCVFAGTTNEDTFLGDPTGARRFWPVRVLRVDLDWIKANRDQLWAEAVAAFRAGESWWLDSTEEEAITEDREQYQREETWEALVAGWLTVQPPDRVSNRDSLSALTAARLLRDALDIPPSQHTTSNITRIGQVMKRLGYVKTRPTLDGCRTWVYSKENLE